MNAVFAIVLIVAGAGIPLMAALNAGLGLRLGSPLPAAFALFLLALAVTSIPMLSNPLPTKAEIAAVPAYFYLGGVLVAFYLLSITGIAPRIGLGNSVFLVLLGQLVSAAAIDHFGLLGVSRSPATTVRIIGIGLIAIGVVLARKPVA